MLDFTSSLYLGMHHPSRSLQPWNQLTTGVPAALASPPGERTAAQKLAELMGCERAVLAPSTLHLFWDLFGILAKEGISIYMDKGTYPIAQWGIERAGARGVSVRSFPHHDADALRRQLKQDTLCRCPVVVADGLCPSCGGPAPIADYLENVRVFGGYLILDDTQALGILGYSPEPDTPYGRGGGGSLRWSNVGGPDVLVVSSLAKGFGVPVAVLAGCSTLVRRFEAKSETRVHCSPPSVAVIHAAKHALSVNQQKGDRLRLRLSQLVRYFRDRLKKAGFSVLGGLFPVQTLAPTPKTNTTTLYRHLLHHGVQTVLHRRCNGDSSNISFLITARHMPCDIDQAVDVLTHTASMKNCNLQSFGGVI